MAEQQISEVLRHPYELLGIDERFLALRALHNDAEFQVPRLVGQTMLILDVGMEHEKNRNEISRELYPGEPTWLISSVYLGKILTRARKATVGLGPSIITKQGRWGTDATYYYEGIPPEQRTADFEGWDDELTRIRFDRRTAYLTVSYNGLRHGARVEGYVKKALLECFLRNPNKEVSTNTLYEALLDIGYDNPKSGVGRNISAFRTYIRRHLGIDPSAILQTRIKGTRNGVQGMYTLLAHSVEVIEEESKSEVATKAVEERISIRDASVVALGLLMKRDSIQRELPPILRHRWPKHTELIALSEAETADADDRSARQIVESEAFNSLERIRDFLDQPNSEESLRQWSPENSAIKSLVMFLDQVDKRPFIIQGQPVRGVDALLHMLYPKPIV